MKKPVKTLSEKGLTKERRVPKIKNPLIDQFVHNAKYNDKLPIKKESPKK